MEENEEEMRSFTLNYEINSGRSGDELSFINDSLANRPLEMIFCSGREKVSKVRDSFDIVQLRMNKRATERRHERSQTKQSKVEQS